jgi:hypothetical protein
LATITSSSANALTTGPNGATNPTFNVDASTASAATGINIAGAAAAGGVAITALSSGTNEGMTIDAKGSGQIKIGATSTGKVVIGKGSAGQPITFSTATVLDAQSGTAAIAELLGGVYRHNSKTGAGTLTTPTGTEISAGIAGVATGYTFDCLYANYGNQTVTITAGASGVTIVGTAAVPTLKNALLRFMCTGANTWLCYVILSA